MLSVMHLAEKRELISRDKSGFKMLKIRTSPSATCSAAINAASPIISIARSASSGSPSPPTPRPSPLATPTASFESSSAPIPRSHLLQRRVRHQAECAMHGHAPNELGRDSRRSNHHRVRRKGRCTHELQQRGHSGTRLPSDEEVFPQGYAAGTVAHLIGPLQAVGCQRYGWTTVSPWNSKRARSRIAVSTRSTALRSPSSAAGSYAAIVRSAAAKRCL